MKTKIFAAISSLKAKAVPLMAGATAAAALAVPSFAADTTTLPTFTITEDMLVPLVQGVISNVAVVFPAGIAIFALFLGIRLVPRLFSSFVKI